MIWVAFLQICFILCGLWMLGNLFPCFGKWIICFWLIIWGFYFWILLLKSGIAPFFFLISEVVIDIANRYTASELGSTLVWSFIVYHLPVGFWTWFIFWALKRRQHFQFALKFYRAAVLCKYALKRTPISVFLKNMIMLCVFVFFFFFWDSDFGIWNLQN